MPATKSLAALLALAAAASSAHAAPFRTGEPWPDVAGKSISAHGGGILFHDGSYYWFGESWGTNGKWDRQGVRVYRSTDLTHWEDRGLVLPMSDRAGDPLEKGGIMERPKVLYNAKTGKFVMWFHHELKGQGYGAAHAAVAVADTIEGPYKLVRTDRPAPRTWPMNFRPTGPGAATRPTAAGAEKAPPGLKVDSFDLDDPKYTRLVHGYDAGQESRDMTVFQDGDGTAYLVYSSEMNWTLHLAELTPDYLGFTGRMVRIFPGKQREAPTLFKRDGKYYLITSGCTGWKPNAADAAVSDSIWGPWRSLGNPWQGTREQRDTSFESQSTWALTIPGTNGDHVLFMGDRWNAKDVGASTYVWAPVEWSKDGKPTLRPRDAWDPAELLLTHGAKALSPDAGAADAN